MQRVSPRRTLVLAIGALCAGAFAAYRDTSAQEAPALANVPGEALTAPAQEKVAAITSAASRTAALESALSGGLLVGDAALAGFVELDEAAVSGDHYWVPLPGGRRAILTLDPALQKKAEEVLERAKAPRAAVVMMSTDGRILALAGRRNGEPTIERDYASALTVWAPAASIFKIVTTSALVADGVGADTKVCYHGGVRSVEASNLTDNARLDSTCNDLRYGLAHSQNAIIAKLFHRNLGRTELGRAARAFGFDSAPEFALEVEPNRFSLPEDELELARTAAGFWSTELSPLGGALVAGTIATGGMSVTPRIVAEVREKDGTAVPVVAEAPQRAIDEAVAREVGDMLVETCDSGTARRAFRDRRGREFLPGMKIAGKTGSLDRDKPSYMAYSWFVGYAPADDPQIVVSVLLGNPPAWYLKAHTAARLLLDEAL